MRTSIALLSCSLALVLSACGGEIGEGSGSLVSVPTSECSSGLKWSGGGEGSSKMDPGRDCMGCHSFAAAGTVYSGFNEATNCAGVQGLTVTITDANGTSWQLTSNAAGNFHLGNASIAWPITASVSDGVNTRVMSTPQYSAACNSCHTESGSNGAPGRVVAP